MGIQASKLFILKLITRNMYKMTTRGMVGVSILKMKMNIQMREEKTLEPKFINQVIWRSRGETICVHYVGERI